MAAGRTLTVVDRVQEFSATLERLRAEGHSIGLVPTMGALHAGHRMLVRRAIQECDRVAVTIFVNPLQFSSHDDLAHYPRSLQGDLSVCDREGASVVFAPPVDEMYPDGQASVLTAVSVRRLTERLEGIARPGHFDGVTTVVAKLFAMAGPCRAYFGEKDFQQLAVVRQMASDLSFPVEVVACPTVRESDGLALSSRNARLSSAERRAAAALYRAVLTGRDLMAEGTREPAAVSEAMTGVLAAEPLVEPEYAVVVAPERLEVPDVLTPGREWRLLVAARVGPVRLIDNLAVRPVQRAAPKAQPLAAVATASVAHGASGEKGEGAG